jgi:hypothetical protein
VVHVVTRIVTPHGVGVFTFTPSLDKQGKLEWTCSASDILAEALPKGCTQEG